MKYELYVVAQAVAKKDVGIKLIDVRTQFAEFQSLAIFHEKSQAEEYLRSVIATVQAGIDMGDRPANNLDPEKSIDLCLMKATLELDPRPMESRGWHLTPIQK